DEMIEQGSQVMIRYGQGKGADLLSAKKKATHFMNEMIHVEKKDLYRSDVNKISFILSSYQDHLDSKKEFADLEVNTWGGRDEEALFGDVGPKDITKKNAIDVLLSYLHADINDTIAFGDAKIDIEMIEYCHIGVAMGNSSQEVKDKADLVCDDVDHDGLYKAFVELGLIE
ncbi:MAG: HAD hydrolase family protein, partial [Traorella sp.]